MHNQDPTKDDFMETIMEIFSKASTYYREYQKQKEKNEKQKDSVEEKIIVNGINETSATDNIGSKEDSKIHIQMDVNININIDPSLDATKIKTFQDVMNKIIEDTSDGQVQTVAKTLHDNPVESMNMMNTIINEQVQKKTEELIQITESTKKLIESLRSEINMNDPKAMEQIATLNYLHTNEQKKLNVAENVLSEIKSISNTGEIINNKEQLSANEISNMLNIYAENLEDNYKFKTEYSMDNKVVLEYDNLNDRGFSGKFISFNMETGKGVEMDYTTEDVNDNWQRVERIENEFSIEQLKELTASITLQKESKEEAYKLLHMYANNLDDIQKNKYVLKTEYKDHDEVILTYDNINDRGFSGKVIKMNLVTGEGNEMNYTTEDVNDSWQRVERIEKKFSKEELRGLSNSLNVQKETEIKSKENERSKSRANEMGGLER